MKTTLEIPDELYRQAKAQAAHKLARIEDYGMPYEGVRVLLK